MTDADVGALELREKAYEVGAGRNLVVRVHPTGVRSWRWRVRSNRTRMVVAIGPWAPTDAPWHLTIAHARAWAEKLQSAERDGVEHLESVVAELKFHLTPAHRLGVAPHRLADGGPIAAAAFGARSTRAILCEAGGCGLRAKAAGLCVNHYARYKQFAAGVGRYLADSPAGACEAGRELLLLKCAVHTQKENP